MLYFIITLILVAPKVAVEGIVNEPVTGVVVEPVLVQTFSPESVNTPFPL